ncbi:MAG: protein-L-isoaspartate O-methyltransferase, partial [Phyllobacterium sp.]|nr:protein-L-isoaspartate O-methyltransferase [Phyllobacterium sp.]
VILFEGGIDHVPGPLFDQLKDGGRLVAVEGAGNSGQAMIYVKNDGVVSGRPAFNSAVKPLPGFERVPEFEF